MAGTIGILVFPASFLWLQTESDDRKANVTARAELLAESVATETEYAVAVGQWTALARHINLDRRPNDVLFIMVERPDEAPLLHIREGQTDCVVTDGVPRCRDEVVQIVRPVHGIRHMGRVHIGVTLEPTRREMRDIAWKMSFAVLLVSLAVFALAGALAHRIGRTMSAANRRLHAELAARQKSEAALLEARNQALDASRLKSEFLANMSHEIRTPMNGVLGMTHVLRSRRLDDDARDMVDTIHASARVLLSLINDILDFSKIEAGRMTMDLGDFDVEHTIDDVLEMLAEAAETKHLDLIPMIETPLPPAMRGDAVRFRQVLTNLVSNAIKFTAHGQVVVRVELVDQVVRVSVEDTGIGVPASAQRYIFEPFRQADGSTSRRFGGTGLGLAIARQLVELMGGRIGMQSTAGQGSTFWFEVPATPSELPVIVPSPLTARVLVCCDRPRVAAALTQRLTVAGAQVVAVTSVADAAAAVDGGFEMLIADLRNAADAEALRAATEKNRLRLTLVTPRGVPRPSPDVDVIVRPWRASRLRALLAPGVPRVVGATRARPVTEAGSGARVLVVDDNVINLKVAARMLDALGCVVTCASSGEEALELLAGSSAFDMVLMDCQMPGMDGFATTRAIRDRERSGRKHLAVIAATASAMVGDRQACLDAGMDDYVSKPLAFEELRRVVRRWATPMPMVAPPGPRSRPSAERSA